MVSTCWPHISRACRRSLWIGGFILNAGHAGAMTAHVIDDRLYDVRLSETEFMQVGDDRAANVMHDPRCHVSRKPLVQLEPWPSTSPKIHVREPRTVFLALARQHRPQDLSRLVRKRDDMRSPVSRPLAAQLDLRCSLSISRRSRAAISVLRWPVRMSGPKDHPWSSSPQARQIATSSASLSTRGAAFAL